MRLQEAKVVDNVFRDDIASLWIVLHEFQGEPVAPVPPAARQKRLEVGIPVAVEGGNLLPGLRRTIERNKVRQLGNRIGVVVAAVVADGQVRPCRIVVGGHDARVQLLVVSVPILGKRRRARVVLLVQGQNGLTAEERVNESQRGVSGAALQQLLPLIFRTSAVGCWRESRWRQLHAGGWLQCWCPNGLIGTIRHLTRGGTVVTCHAETGWRDVFRG